MSDLQWDDRLLAACESAACPCGHVALDHEWHGCEECGCGKSAIHALMTSGVVTVQLTEAGAVQ